MKSDQSIGIFDSGVGGLTVVKAIHNVLPNESLIYLGDTARVPYGSKSPAVVKRYALNSAKFLVRKGAKALVIACNTASAVALEALQEELTIPVLGVIEPGAALASKVTKNNHIGIIGTEGTIASGAYQAAITAANPDSRVTVKSCPLLVPLAEEGMTDHPATWLLAKEYLAPLIESGVDTVVLGCTHYPILAETLSKVLGPDIRIVDSATAVAQSIQMKLVEHNLLAEKKRRADTFFATDAGPRFNRIGSAFLGDKVVEEVHHVDL